MQSKRFPLLIDHTEHLLEPFKSGALLPKSRIASLKTPGGCPWDHNLLQKR
ncbi:hypothetical protein [Streptomyces sp. MMBL 11-3]|uniref:hypothetical protein n=1 Tax=Streptomyces sp. MMBL 11-3 TaxID=3382639 RepID=UPI0039B44650